MPVLMDLPTELLLEIFGSLSDADLKSLLIAQGVCRRFQDIIVSFLQAISLECGPAVHGFIKSNFGVLLDSAVAVTAPANFHTYPYQCLPFASNPTLRAKYLRPNASWLRIPLVSPDGHVVHRMQQITKEVDVPNWSSTSFPYCLLEAGHVGFRQAGSAVTQFEFPQGIGIGLLYTGWALLMDTKVSDPVEFHTKYTRTVTGTERFTDDVIRSLLVPEQHYAVLHHIVDLGVQRVQRPLRLDWIPGEIGSGTKSILEFPAPEIKSTGDVLPSGVITRQRRTVASAFRPLHTTVTGDAGPNHLTLGL